MSETHINGASPQQHDNLPVLASPEARPIERLMNDSPLPAPAMAATGGFLAGVATLVLVRILRRSAHRPRRGIGIRRSKRGDRSLEIAGSRSFLVDVHVLKR
jgi:hypothetical protein